MVYGSEVGTQLIRKKR